MTAAYCTYCGKAHPKALCPHTWAGSSARLHLRCTYCGSNLHAARYCPKTYSGSGNRRREPNGAFLDGRGRN